MNFKQVSFAILMVFLIVTLIGCNSKTSSDDPDSELKISLNAQPESLDPQISSTVVSEFVTRNIFETLVALNAEFEPVPMLAESIDESEDGKTYTFKLREGVKFHNGEEMTSSDVVASMNRWLEVANPAKLLGEANFEAKDEFTVVLNLEDRMAKALHIMASNIQNAAIMPEEIVQNSGSDVITEYIGTGPYAFEEWKQDQYIKLVKFDDYQNLDSESSGLSGNKKASIQEITYLITTDSSTRVAGVETGEYDIAIQIPSDEYERLKGTENVETHTHPGSSILIIYNKKEGIASDPEMRRAINTAFDMDEIMKASFVEDLYELHPGYMSPDNATWNSTAGEEFYNQANLDKAKTMLDELDYDGETVKLMTSREYIFHYNTAVVVKEQLEKLGMNVELEIYDWATLLDRRNDPALWDIHIQSNTYFPTPLQLLPLSPDYAGWTDDPKITELMNEIGLEKDAQNSKELWNELQEFLWEEYLPLSLAGHSNGIIATSHHVESMELFHGGINPWNVTLTK
ncbi:ABC transporter substrate-binding protein [Ornithinibacillus sp. 4-3]|uniref:ABC transporter substrate-binding protein n=1 Tax=Ornithinibacillus sp. 4-3 TaxID=3231488 RepID=A0AB39HQ67_9BACI